MKILRYPSDRTATEGCEMLRRMGSMLVSMSVNMALIAALSGVCGLCLHTVLKADRSERSTVLLLNSLCRMEQQLRGDLRRAGPVSCTESEMQLQPGQATRIDWSIQRGIVSREESVNAQVSHRERYVFPAGTQIRFLQETPQRVLVRIQEPSPFVRYPEAGNGGAVLNKPEAVALPVIPASTVSTGVIEIQLVVPSQLAGVSP